MERERSHKRTIKDIRRDFRWGDIGEELTSENDRRHRALKEVMLSIPEEEDYRKLKDQLGIYNLFIPSKDGFGEIFGFESITNEEKGSQIRRVALVIYLDPRLEEMEDDDIAIAVTAHELAHIVK